MKKFMGDDFLLNSELAVKIFNEMKNLPIIDYHCHLEPKEIADNLRFKNITEIWLYGDHYKWRLMRANGIEEQYITGNASDYEKFEKWAATIEDCIGSPLYHWTHLELARYFDYHGLLSKKTAKECWDICNAAIQSDDFNVWNILKKFNVESLCTTDDPADTLEHHRQLAESGMACKVLPTLRPSKLMDIANKGYTEYVEKLSVAADCKIEEYSGLVAAVRMRIEFFDLLGCKLSDTALDPPVFEEYSPFEIDVIFRKAMNDRELTDEEVRKYKTALLIDMGKIYAELGWTMQLHMNAKRNNNTPMFEKLGADKGYDSIMDAEIANPLSSLLDALAKEDKLPRCILYSLNPAHDDLITTMIGNFQGGGIRGKMQHGSAWWFNDTKSGMEKQMISLANNGMLSTFIGMLTDSRSFLSYTRHEYFRRIVANMLADWAIKGEFPNDFDKLAEIGRNIAYYNAKNYFDF